MADYKPGSMDISAHHKTFSGFVTMVKWGLVIVVLILVVMALANA